MSGMSDVSPVAFVACHEIECLGFLDCHTSPSVFGAKTDRHDTPLYSHATVTALMAERDALAKDAERYRWLRQNEKYRSDVFLANSHEELDAAIDAMTKGERG